MRNIFRFRGESSSSTTSETTPIINSTEDDEQENENLSRSPSSDLDVIKIKPCTYKRRWIVLLSYFILSVHNNLMQYSFSSIEKVTLNYYTINSTELNLLALVFMVTGFTIRFGAMWIIDSLGLGIGIFISAILNVIGCWIRYFPGYHPEQYYWLLAGQSVCAISQSFIDITGPKLAANWFPPKERTTATALGQGSIFVAVLLSYALVPRFVTSGDVIPRYLLIEAILSTVAAIFIFAFFRDTPPTPPSYSAAVEKMKFFDAMKSILRNKNFIIISLVFGITIGTGLAFSVLMDQVVEPYGYSNAEAGTLATVWISSAIVGGAIGGPIIDKTRAYKVFIIGSLALVAIGLTVFTFVLVALPRNLPLLCVVIAVIGQGSAGMPAILEATIETIYPIPEATAMGLLFFVLNIAAIVLTLGMERLKNPKTGSYQYSLYGAIGLCVAGCILAAFFKGDYRRLKYEKVEKEKQKASRVTTYQAVV